MAYQTKFDGRTTKDINVGGEGNPQTIEGYFIGTQEFEGTYGLSKKHIFKTSDGYVGVWGKSRMNVLLTDDLRGQMCLLKFTGMVAPTKKGRRASYGYELMHDPDNVIQAPSLNPPPSAASQDDEEEGSIEAAFDSGDSEEESYDELPPQKAVAPKVPASTPSTSQQQRVKELLNRSKNRSA